MIVKICYKDIYKKLIYRVSILLCWSVFWLPSYIKCLVNITVVVKINWNSNPQFHIMILCINIQHWCWINIFSRHHLIINQVLSHYTQTYIVYICNCIQVICRYPTLWLSYGPCPQETRLTVLGYLILVAENINKQDLQWELRG